MSKKNSFLKGATILGLAGIFIKILGAAFKIPLAGKIGAEGMSYFMAPYPIYNWLLVVATAGIPTAIARMIAEKETIGDTHGIFRIIRVIFKPMIVVAIVFSAILFFGAESIARIVGLDEAKYAFMTIAPALLFVPIMSIFRGFFQGIQRLKSFAISQIVEQLFRVVVGLTLAFFLFSKGVQYSAAGATFGAAIGSFFGLLIIYYIYRVVKKNEFKALLSQPAMETTDTDWSILKQLLMISVPITIGASIMPTMNSIDLMLVVNRLNSIGIENAKELYGILTGFAVTIVNFPQILTASLQISLVPAVTQLVVAYNKSVSENASDVEEHRKHLSDTVNAGIKTALIIGLPCAIGLVTLSEPVMLLLYSSQVESAKIGAQILSVLAWDLIFLAVYQATTGILQGLKKQMLPALHLAVGLIFKVVLTYTLVGIPMFGVTGAAISTIAAFAVASALNVWVLAKESYLDVNIFKLFIKPAISAAVMGAFVLVAYNPLSNVLGSKFATLVTIIIAVIIYGGMILATKTLHDHEYDMLPGGSKLKKLAKKLGR